MSLNTSGDAGAISDAMIGFKSPDPDAGFSMVPVISKILDDGFQAGSVSLPNVDISPPAGSFMLPCTSGQDMPELIGAECARYWSAAIGPGSPVSCSSITVSNDAAKIASPIAGNLRSLFGTGYLTPNYFDFVNAIHKEVKTIIWTVAESGPKCSANFVVTVS